MYKFWQKYLVCLLTGLICYTNVCFACSKPSIAYQVGQLMMVGFDGTKLNDQSFVVQQMKHYHIGGVIIFDHYVNYKNTGKPKTRNILSPDQLKKLTTQLQFYAKKYHVYPLLIAVNQEGGQITTLKKDKGFNLNLNYSQAQLGADHPELIFKQAWVTGKLLREYGINVNLAPVAALNSNPNNPAIGQLERTFGRDPIRVSRDIINAMKGYKSAKIVCALKHFPGMGSGEANTDDASMVDVSNTWSFNELIPYQSAISSGVMCPLVMISHVVNTRLESQELPASLSYPIVTKLLRERFHYSGVVITDAIDVDSISLNFSLPEAASLAISAGDNIILYDGGRRNNPNADISEIYQAILSLAKNDSRFRKKVMSSYLRVKKLKTFLLTNK